MHSDVLIVADRAGCRASNAAAGSRAPHHRRHRAPGVGGGDPAGRRHHHIRVIVEPGARLRLRSAAATVALPGAARSHQSRPLGPRGGRRPRRRSASRRSSPAAPGTSVDVRLRLTAAGAVRMRERVQIGRTDERARLLVGIAARRRGRQPLLRHRIELGAGSVADDATRRTAGMRQRTALSRDDFARRRHGHRAGTGRRRLPRHLAGRPAALAR